MEDTTNDAKQAAATEITVTEPATLPATETAPAPGTEQTPPTDGQKTDEPPKPDPRDRAIRQLAFEQRETRRKLKEAEDRLAQAQPPRDPNAPPSQADLDRMVDERAQAIVAQREQAAKTESWVSAGNAAYPDFNDRCNALADMGAGENAAFMTAIGKLPEGHKVIAELATDPAEATRILKLPPVDLALELAGLSARIAAHAAPDPEPKPKPTTQAPPPIKPITTAARAEVNPNTMTEAEYQAWWNKRTRG